MKYAAGRSLLIWALFTVLAIAQLLHTRIVTDLTAYIPASDGGSLGKLSRILTEGSAARIWLVALSGDDPDSLGALSQRFAERLRKYDALRTILNGSGQTLGSSRELINKYRYLLDRRVEKGLFGEAMLRQELQARLQDLRSPWSSFSKLTLASDPTASTMHVLLEQMKPGQAPRRYAGVWFSDDLSHALMLIETRAGGMNLDAQQRVQEKINATFADVAIGSVAKLTLSGPALFALASRERIRDEAKESSLLASGLLLIFMAWVFPSLSRLALLAVPLLLGTLGGAVAVSLAFGFIHGITLAFGITLLGTAIDYPVHLFAHQREGETLRASVRDVWPTLRLGMITTVLAYLTFSLSAIPGLAQLGLMSACGLLVAALATRYLLPALGLRGSSRGSGLWSFAGVMRAPNLPLKLLLPMTLVLLIIGYGALPQRIWPKDIADLSPIPAQLREQDHQLREQLKAPEPRYLLGVSGSSVEAVLQRQEQLWPQLDGAVIQGELEGFQMAAQILPSQSLQRDRLARLPNDGELRKCLKKAMAGLPFKSGVFSPFLADVQATRSLPPLSPLQFSGTPLGTQLGVLLIPNGSQWLGLVKLVNVHHPQTLGNQIQAANIPGVEFYDIKQQSNKLLAQFREDAVQRMVWAAGIILLLLLLALRDIRKVARVSLAVLLAVALAFALPLWLGESLNLFHLVSLMLVAGIGIDYGLFFARDDAWGGRVMTRAAVLACVISSVIVFVILAASKIPVLHSIGVTVASGVSAAFLLAWLFAYRSGNKASQA